MPDVACPQRPAQAFGLMKEQLDWRKMYYGTEEIHKLWSFFISWSPADIPHSHFTWNLKSGSSSPASLKAISDFLPALSFISCLPIASLPKVFLENNTSLWLTAPQSYKARGKKINNFNTTLRLVSSDIYSLQLYLKILLFVLLTIFRTMLKISRLWFMFRIPDEILFVAFLG